MDNFLRIKIGNKFKHFSFEFLEKQLKLFNNQPIIIIDEHTLSKSQTERIKKWINEKKQLSGVNQPPKSPIGHNPTPPSPSASPPTLTTPSPPPPLPPPSLITKITPEEYSEFYVYCLTQAVNKVEKYLFGNK